MNNVESVIKIIVVFNMIFWLYLFFILLKNIFLIGWMRKVVVNVLNVSISCNLLLLILEKNNWFKIIVKYVYNLKLNYFIVFFILVVIIVFLVCLGLIILMFWGLKFKLLFCCI